MSRSKNKLKDEFQDKEYAHAYVNEFLNTQIATQIRVLREQRGLTQEQLASMADMKQSRISLLENVFYDKWSISTLNKLAEVFDVPLNVSFETFSDRITDMQNLSRESLARSSREDDLFSSSETETNSKASSNNVIPFLISKIDRLSTYKITEAIPSAQVDNTEISRELYNG